MYVYTNSRQQITVADDIISSGGEGEVRRIIAEPNSMFHNTCVKIYFNNKRSKSQEAKINYMIQHPPGNILGKGYKICWPVASIYDDNGNFIGFIMPLAHPGCMKLTILTSINIKKRHPEEWHKKFDRKNGAYTLVNRLKLINNMLIPIHMLHASGKYVIKDLKPDNILITSTGMVSLIDMDSIQISDGRYLFPGAVATPEYIPGEFYKNSTISADNAILSPSWDMFAVGVILYQILIGLHPYTVIPKQQTNNDENDIFRNIAKDLFPFGAITVPIDYPPAHDRFTILPQPVKDMFIQTFISDSTKRPSAMDWLQVLKPEIDKCNNVQPIEVTDKKPSTDISIPNNRTQHDKPDQAPQNSKKNKKTDIHYLIIIAIITIAITLTFMGSLIINKLW